MLLRWAPGRADAMDARAERGTAGGARATGRPPPFACAGALCGWLLIHVWDLAGCMFRAT